MPGIQVLRRAAGLLVCLAVFLLVGVAPATAQEVEIDAPSVALSGVPVTVSVSGVAPPAEIRVNDRTIELEGDEDEATAEVELPRTGRFQVHVISDGEEVAETSMRTIPGWLSLLPPIIAIGMALVFKRVVPALFLGVWIGAWIAAGGLWGWWIGLLDAFEVHVLQAVADPGHASIILFSLMIGGMVGIISRNGGTRGIVQLVVGWASNARRGQLSTAFMGLAIFFDDYANTLIVGNTMRSVTDKLRISREKLAYLVDSTAAPIATIALVTTWIGFQVGLIGESVEQIEGFDMAAYTVFLNSIPYSFYPILALVFVFLIASTNRDFGPMHAAEERARTTGELLGPDAKVDEAAADGKELAAKEGVAERALNAIIPVVVLVVSVLGGLYVTGEGATIQERISTADSYTALMWGSLLGVLVAALLSIGQRLLTLNETVDAWYGGIKSMLFAMIVLVLAWALSSVTEVLHTAEYLQSLLGDQLHPGIVPALIFLIAAATAFATGSSWGTMGILLPLVIPLVWAILQANNMAEPEHYHIMYSSVSVVLAGAVWGDHCSPISDTTVLSSMASGCDHIDHVNTQLPYAMAAGLVALLLGTLPAGFGFPWWLSLMIGVLVLIVILRVFGKPVSPVPADARDPDMREA